MTDEQINIAIAESLGWTKIVVNEIRIVGAPPKCPPPYDEYGLIVPNYTADLNACHEFENTLTIEQSSDYVWNLNHYHQTARIHDFDDIAEMRTEVFKIVNATALQRCEAYLRTIGKWIE